MSALTTLNLPRRPTPRPRARRRFVGSFAGAASNRLTADWFAVLLSADRELKGNLRELRARSRQLHRDSAHLAGFVQALKDNVFGPEGIMCNPRMRAPRGKLLKDDNLAAWEAWAEWGKRETCTAEGQNNWRELERLVLGTWWVDGEVLVRRLPGFENAFGYTLQMLDADLLDETYNVPPGPGRNEISQSVEINAYGRPLAYHLWTAHPSDLGARRERIRVPASEILHLFIQHRAGARRGLPLATPILIALHMLDGYTDAEVTAARIAASQGGFFTQTGEDAVNLGVTEAEGEDADLPIEMEAEPGLARKLPAGWQFEPWDPKHPSQNFGAFQKAMLKVIARGLNASSITFSGDYSDTTYGSGRQAMISEREAFRTTQRWLSERLHDPVYRDVIRQAVLTGKLQLPTPEPSRWSQVQWQFRGWPWLDPKNDIEAVELELALHLTSPQRICAERGRDYEEILDEEKEARDLCAARGIPWPDGAKALGRPTAPTNGQPGRNGNGNGNGSNGNGAHRLTRELAALEAIP